MVSVLKSKETVTFYAPYALSLVDSMSEYIAPVWYKIAYVNKVYIQLNSSMRTVVTCAVQYCTTETTTVAHKMWKKCFSEKVKKPEFFSLNFHTDSDSCRIFPLAIIIYS